MQIPGHFQFGVYFRVPVGDSQKASIPREFSKIDSLKMQNSLQNDSSTWPGKSIFKNSQEMLVCLEYMVGTLNKCIFHTRKLKNTRNRKLYNRCRIVDDNSEN